MKPEHIAAGIAAAVAFDYIRGDASFSSRLVYSFVITALTTLALNTFAAPGEWKNGLFSILNHSDSKFTDKNEVEKSVAGYESMFGSDSRAGGEEHSKLLKKRQDNYTDMVNKFYDLVTDFYEYGWGESFHFGPCFAKENFQESLRRHEYYLAHRMGLDEKHTVADFGCGVGGPARNIARFSGAKIVGINNNDYQIKVGNKHCARDQLSHLVSFFKTDFMHVDFPDGHFDHAYEIEATCHAPDKVACFKEIHRLVKPGGYFAGYEWVMTDKYDASNPEHVALKRGIEVGNGLPDIVMAKEVDEALRKSGFEFVDALDIGCGPRHHPEGEKPWYWSLQGSYSLSGFRMTKLGRTLTHGLVTLMEKAKIAPPGSTRVSKLLNDTANDLVRAGELGIFTPCYFFIGRKPLTA